MRVEEMKTKDIYMYTYMREREKKSTNLRTQIKFESLGVI